MAGLCEGGNEPPGSLKAKIVHQRHFRRSSDKQEASPSNSDTNLKLVDKVLDEDSSEDQQHSHSASENFLQNLREQCKKHVSISLICNNLRLILPITSKQPVPKSSTSSEEVFETTNVRTEPLLQDKNIRNRLKGFVEEEVRTLTPDQDDQITVMPMDNRYQMYYEHMIKDKSNNGYEVPGNERLPLFESINFDPEFQNSANIPRPEAYDKRPEEFEHKKLLKHRSDVLKSGYTPEPQEPNDFIAPDESPNVAYLNHKMSDEPHRTENKQNTHYENVYSKSIEVDDMAVPNADLDNDYDEIVEDNDGVLKREGETNLETQGEHTQKHVRETQEEISCDDSANCLNNSTDENGTETDTAISEREDIADRIIDDSVKIFKNSVTVKFPTFETVTNKIKEWYQSMFGPASRDEARGKLKKTLNPIFIGLLIKGVIVLASVIGFVMKMVAVKFAFFSLATVIIASVFMYRKMNAPQGGTIYVHTNGYKTGSAWDKDGYNANGHPQRALKDITGLDMWGKQHTSHKGEHSTTPLNSDNYYQYYNNYYKPSPGVYTTASSYIT
ncbi:hypothetical protein ANN_02408 [Periplaneta americana]|uniref:Uncharacterized protein n=1 Tax=Periplaneta americana TaxID=6978 RepID=A0ABQ8TWA0_PERAM|nr:hypothetical protein ANN_02408 [Periplaneta americana]